MTNDEIDDFRRNYGAGHHSMLAIEEVCAQAKEANALRARLADAEQAFVSAADPDAAGQDDCRLGETLLDYTIRNFNECCGAWSDVKNKDGTLDQAKCDYASAIEKRVRGAIREQADALERLARERDDYRYGMTMAVAASRKNNERAEAAERKLAAARDEALEKAKKACRDLGRTYFESGGLGTNCTDMCIKAIDALKGQP